MGSCMAVLPVARERLAGFRAGWYGCLGRWADTLFELTDAVLCAGGPVTSLPRLSLEAVPARAWQRVCGAGQGAGRKGRPYKGR